ncbi:ferredoxin [Mucilaginibacter terrenus]|uniref:Ferredoxin n=1 Tax=Mucilaginibacter terrenus TaxID=2482727 RepID=A0A3E2NWA0_9SPHI|nr:2Fe-2S iron-sulfur cluster-binding protein [Mucilaginibacter terrenus]RFZ85130.1 ferredoxin [Mucilaginibacter terrenus]
MIVLTVENRNGGRLPVEVPEDISLSLMELLKAMGYPIAATCGGLALCATCHVEVLQGAEQLPQPNDAELQMLDTLPALTAGSRLSCQVKIAPIINGMVFRIMPEQ